MKTIYIVSVLSFVLSSPVAAEVKTVADTGFSTLHIAEVDATPEVIWARLIKPKDYWSAEHSWSGSVAGFTLDPRADGCFCEAFQEKGADGKIKTVGTVEHMRVIFAQPGKVLRMQGALGPLQSEAMLGTLTVAIAPLEDGAGSKISFSYVAGGYMRYKTADIAPAVDKVLGEQFANLIKPFLAQDKKASEWSLDVEKLDLGEGSANAVDKDKGLLKKDTDKPNTLGAVKSGVKDAPKPLPDKDESR